MAEAGDFGTAVYASLKKRCPEKGDMSVYDINAALDALNSATDRCLQLPSICTSTRFKLSNRTCLVGTKNTKH